MARREIQTRETTEMTPQEVSAPADMMLAQTPEGVAVLAQREARFAANDAVNHWREIATSYQKDVFPALVSLAGSLAGQSRDAYAQLGEAMAKLSEQTPSFSQQAMDFVRENPEIAAAVLTPILASAGGALAAYIQKVTPNAPQEAPRSGANRAPEEGAREGQA
jgi:hypothetical protein